MSNWIVLFVIVAIVLLAIIPNGKKERERKRSVDGVIEGKKPLTNREESMYWRLTAALPDLIVLSQVSFSAFLKTKGNNTLALRNTFDRKTADFLVLNKGFEILAVIELDDSSHKGKEAKDEARDAMLTKAGFRVIRYANIPDLKKVHEDFRAERMHLIEEKLKRKALNETAQDPVFTIDK